MVPFKVVLREEVALLRSTVLPDAVGRDEDELELKRGVERLSMPPRSQVNSIEMSLKRKTH
jgi:hypothetical protein